MEQPEYIPKFQKNQIVLLQNGQPVRIKACGNPNKKYLVSLDVHTTWPDTIFGACLYVHEDLMMTEEEYVALMKERKTENE